MSNKVLGIHHITAISGAPHQNYHFYTRVLGLKMVKKTVNYDDPGTYHLYYGDATGSPGSLLTFFPYEGRPGRPGPGQVTVTSYAVADLAEWEKRLQAHSVAFQRRERFGQSFLRLSDPHGMGVELLESPTTSGEAEDGVSLKGELGKFAGAVISLVKPDATRELLEFLGYQVVDSENGRTRLKVPGGQDFLELEKVAPAATSGGPGTVHHIALRVPDDASQVEWRRTLLEKGYQVSPVTDRNYFHSIYFRGPEGVLYELATDPPGMLIDEDAATLGTSLRLPPQYERYREALVEHLAPLETAFRTFEKPGRQPMLVGLHGTGGDEHDLIPLLTQLDPEAHLLTLRGQVSENGQARFFRRLREGVFDLQDLAERGRELGQFLTGRPEEKVVVGYSNGANIAAYTAMAHPEAVEKAVLIRPMLGWKPPGESDLKGKRILILIGARDTVVSPESGRELARALLELGAHVDVEEVSAGHELTPQDVRLTYQWLRQAAVAAR